MNIIASRLKMLHQDIANILADVGRGGDPVCLLAVSKTRSLAEIEAAITAEQLHFGENQVQEALPKIEALCDRGLVWHFIGNLQQNKTRKIAESFDWVDSLDSIRIAERLNSQRPAHLGRLNVCIQVNISCDPHKNGIDVNELDNFANQVQLLPRLKLRGLMTILQDGLDSITIRSYYRELKQFFEHLKRQGYQLDTLSMGMSGDYEEALLEGATTIRLGTWIFGAREAGG
jgi:pyridoxal phosphate enzyme (YggS family)